MYVLNFHLNGMWGSHHTLRPHRHPHTWVHGPHSWSHHTRAHAHRSIHRMTHLIGHSHHVTVWAHWTFRAHVHHWAVGAHGHTSRAVRSSRHLHARMNSLTVTAAHRWGITVRGQGARWYHTRWHWPTARHLPGPHVLDVGRWNPVTRCLTVFQVCGSTGGHNI